MPRSRPAGPNPPVHAAIALGSNLGDRAAAIHFAFDNLDSLPATRLIAASSIIETPPAGPILQGPYLNAAALIETTLPPCDLLDRLLEIERARGRQRSLEQRWGPRTLDLDLLLYGDHILDEPGLIIPHPRLHERSFVLIPLAQVAGDMLVPTLGKTVLELRDSLEPARTATPPPTRIEGKTL